MVKVYLFTIIMAVLFVGIGCNTDGWNTDQNGVMYKNIPLASSISNNFKYCIEVQDMDRIYADNYTVLDGFIVLTEYEQVHVYFDGLGIKRFPKGSVILRIPTEKTTITERLK